MVFPVQPYSSMAVLSAAKRVATLIAAAALLWAQAGPPGLPKRPMPELSARLPDLRRRLDSAKAVNVTAQRALEYSRIFLTSAEQAYRLGQQFRAGRFAEAADALFHVAEHQSHLQAGGGPKGAPPADTLGEHMQRVYFRTQQADYFFRQSHDLRAVSLPKWARDFYQLAVRAFERNDAIAADENVKCAEEVVRALESLAQAATPANENAPLPPPPRPPGEAH